MKMHPVVRENFTDQIKFRKYWRKYLKYIIFHLQITKDAVWPYK